MRLENAKPFITSLSGECMLPCYCQAHVANLFEDPAERGIHIRCHLVARLRKKTAKVELSRIGRLVERIGRRNKILREESDFEGVGMRSVEAWLESFPVIPF